MKLLSIFASAVVFSAAAAEIPLKDWKAGKDGMTKITASKIEIDDVSPERAGYASTTAREVTPGAYYLLRFKASVFSATNRASLGSVSFEFSDSDGKPCGDRISFGLPFDTRGERDLRLAARAPENAAKVRIVVRSFQLPLGKLAFRAFDLAETDQKGYDDARAFVPDYGPDFPAPTPAELTGIAAALPKAPFSPAPPCSDRSFWDAVGGKIDRKDEIIAKAQEYLAAPFPVVDKALYLAAYGSGMKAYRDAFHQRGDMLTTLVLAECLENRGRFREKIAEWTAAILEEPTWVLPMSDRGKINIENRGVTVDLGSTGRAAMLMTVKRLFPDLLDPALAAKIDQTVKQRVLDPFRNCILGGRLGNGFNWILALNNWGAVCSANIVYSAGCMGNTPEYNAPIVAGAVFCAKTYLESFAEDGYCSEGVGYWNYGFGHYMLLADILADWTGGKIDLFALPKAKLAASFIDRFELHGRRFPAFADCAISNGVKPYNELAAARFFGCASYRNNFWINDFLPQSVRGIRILADSAAPKRSAAPAALRDYFESSQVLISRGSGFSFAAKGGNNNELHNHNDLGSFVLYSGKTLTVCDPGLEVYTMDTFSTTRYRSDLVNSFGHSVPVVAGELQQPGTKYRAGILSSSFTPEADALRLNLRDAYEVPALKTLTRDFVFNRTDQTLTVEDRFEFTAPNVFESALVSYESFVRIDDLHWRIGANEDAVVLEVTASQPVESAVTTLKAQSASSKTPANRLGFKFIGPVDGGSIKFTFKK